MEIFRQGKLEVADEILTPDFVLRNPTLPSELTHGPEGVKKFASGVVESSSGYQITHHDTISKGDKVLIRWTFTGMVKKEMLGIIPSDGVKLQSCANNLMLEVGPNTSTPIPFFYEYM